MGLLLLLLLLQGDDLYGRLINLRTEGRLLLLHLLQLQLVTRDLLLPLQVINPLVQRRPWLCLHSGTGHGIDLGLKPALPLLRRLLMPLTLQRRQPHIRVMVKLHGPVRATAISVNPRPWDEGLGGGLEGVPPGWPQVLINFRLEGALHHFPRLILPEALLLKASICIFLVLAEPGESFPLLSLVLSSHPVVIDDGFECVLLRKLSFHLL
jgi:hypothetical protein|mmetsp:Transcript_33102/g.55408  ORF Transcript_33102/g.55408 Transcript_33102/m.55408 type:complete len:210 (+) Transcript_33102:1808-2437(+)